MGKVLITGGGGAGGMSDDMTAANGVTADLVPKGQTYIGADTDDEIGTGTMELEATANAQTGHVLNGEKFFTKNEQLPNKPLTGTMPDIGALDTTTKARVSNNHLILGMSNGAHIKNGGSGTLGTPEVQIPFSSLKDNKNLSAELKAENIKSGATIFGKTGTFKGVGTASAGDVLEGKTFSNGTVMGGPGSMPDRKDAQYTSSMGGFGVNGYWAFNKIPMGYYHSTSTNNNSWAPEIRMANEDFIRNIGLTADKIAYGTTFCGVAGTGLPHGQSIGPDIIYAPGAFGSDYNAGQFVVRPTINQFQTKLLTQKIEERTDYIYIQRANGYGANVYDGSIYTGTWALNHIIANTGGLYKQLKLTLSGIRYQKSGGTLGGTGIHLGTTLYGDDLGTWSLENTNAGTQKTFTCDISNVTQSFYISVDFDVWSSGTDSTPIYTYIHKIELVKK